MSGLHNDAKVVPVCLTAWLKTRGVPFEHSSHTVRRRGLLDAQAGNARRVEPDVVRVSHTLRVPFGGFVSLFIESLPVILPWWVMVREGSKNAENQRGRIRVLWVFRRAYARAPRNWNCLLLMCLHRRGIHLRSWLTRHRWRRQARPHARQRRLRRGGRRRPLALSTLFRA